MTVFSTRGIAGTQIIVKPSELNAGMVTVQILSKDESESSCITIPAHTANMLAAALEHEAVNAFAIELMTASERGAITLRVRDERWIDATVQAV
jgi:hypothetical protein